MVGNKSDLANERQISKQAAQEYAKEIDAIMIKGRTYATSYKS